MQSTLILRKWKEEKTVAFNFFKNYTDFLVNILKIQIKQKVVLCWVSKAYLYMQNNLLSSMVNSGHQDHFKAIYFFFTKSFHTHKKHKKHKSAKAPNANKQFLSPKSFCARKKLRPLLFFPRLYFRFVSLFCFLFLLIFVLLVCFCLWVFLCAWNLLVKKAK